MNKHVCGFWLFFLLLIGGVSAQAQPVAAWQNANGTFKGLQIAVRRGQCQSSQLPSGTVCWTDRSFTTNIPVTIWNVSASVVQAAATNNTRVNLGNNAYFGFRRQLIRAGLTDTYQSYVQVLYFNALVYGPNGAYEWLSAPMPSIPNPTAVDPPAPQPEYVCSAMYGPLVLRRNLIPTGTVCRPCSELNQWTSPHNLGDYAAVFFDFVRYVALAEQNYDNPWAGSEWSSASWTYNGSPVTTYTYSIFGTTVTYRECQLSLTRWATSASAHTLSYLLPDLPPNTYTNDMYTWMDRAPVPTIREMCGASVDPNVPVVAPHPEYACVAP